MEGLYNYFRRKQTHISQLVIRDYMPKRLYIGDTPIYVELNSKGCLNVGSFNATVKTYFSPCMKVRKWEI